MFLIGIRKKHLHDTISKRLRSKFSKYVENKCLYILVYVPKKSFVQFSSGGDE